MNSVRIPGRAIKQDRGRKTYTALVETGFKLLESRDLESIPIAELARSAGYSVGAFYARFSSKDEYFDALIARHLEQRDLARERLFAKTDDDELIEELVKDVVRYYWKNRGFWRAALIRSTRDPAFWAPMRDQSHTMANTLIERMTRKSGRQLSKAEETNVRFAFQAIYGTINNSIMNRPGPVQLGQRSFVSSLVRAFRLISDYDRIMRRAPGAAALATSER